MFNLQGLGTASLDVFGGLITNLNPTDLPEGSSPRLWDVDFIIGSVFTRAGLASVYTFSASIVITGVQIYNGIITFSYTGTQPAVNEEFLLSGFTGSLAFLNETVVIVASSSPTVFLVDSSYPNIGPFTGLNGTAQSLTGNFSGPNLGTLATVTGAAPQISWSNPNGVLGTSSYATVTTGVQASRPLNVTEFSFAIPSTSGVTGFGVSFTAFSSAATTVKVQLLKNGIPVGTTKTVILTTTPTVYSLGTPGDVWGSTWLYSDVNNTQFGVQIVASGVGITNVQDLDVLTYLSPSLANFNYVKSYIQNDGQTDTLALDADGIVWKEDVTNNPGVLSVVLTGILPGSYAKSATANDREYICFSDLFVGTDRPRVYDGTAFRPLSQVGPGAPPSFVSSVGAGAGSALTLTKFVISTDIVTFDYSTGTEPTPGQVYVITVSTPGFGYLNFTGTVLGSPAPSASQFSMDLVHANVTATVIAGAAALSTSYPITSITQRPANPKGSPWQDLLWSAGPGSTTPGTVLTIYYSIGAPNNDFYLITALNSGQPVYVFLASLPAAFGFAGTYQVTGVGLGTPPGAGAQRYYFTVNVATSGYAHSGASPSGTYQQTLATMTLGSSVPNLAQGDIFTITGATPTGWNNTWTVETALNSGLLNIVSSEMLAGGIAQYGWSQVSGTAPTMGQTVTIAQCTNNVIFNTTGVISNVSGALFQVSGFVSPIIPFAVEAQGSAITFGNEFTFDPGVVTLGTNNSPIYGTDTSSGSVSIVGGTIVPIGAGTRQAVVFFITESGYWTAPSPPITFTTSSNANFILATNIPIGPPNVVARGIAITEAGQNGVAGANFYVIPNDVVITVGQTVTRYTSTIIRDNTSTTAQFTFTDAVLLNSEEVDVQGNDLFNLIELGSSAWCVPYASRMFYGLQLNKVQDFNNLTFDGGYLPNPGGPILPLGWGLDTFVPNNVTLLVSQATGMSLYIENNTGITQPFFSIMYQTAYQNPFQTPIIQPNTTYSIRVAVSNPSGISQGTLVFQLQDFNSGTGFGRAYGSFSIPLNSMSTNTKVFSGTFLTTPFTTTVPSDLVLDFLVTNMGAGADVEIDRIEVYPTLQPFLLAQVFGSYIDDLEAIDASGSGGIIDTTGENPQTCMGGFVMHNILYLLKTDSWYFTEDNPNSEPGGWGLQEVSNRVGTIGIHSYDVGEEWCVTACREGIYGFNGGQPIKISQEIWNLWNKINWHAGNSIVLRNDIVNKRILCAVPLPTPNQWLPFDPVNPAPTSPNVILMLNYQGLASFEELVSSPQVHTTMFGTLASPDMKRKWSIWRIKTPYMDFIARQDVEQKPLFVCNGIDSSKIYQFLDDQLSDDGVAINGLYTTYGFVNAVKAATLPIFGFHAKRYTVLQFTTYGAGLETVRVLPNVLNPKYPYTVPGGVKLVNPAYDDWMRPLNVRGNRAFLEFSTNAVGAWFNLSKVLLSGKADPYSPINPLGGGNAGISN